MSNELVCEYMINCSSRNTLGFWFHLTQDGNPGGTGSGYLADLREMSLVPRKVSEMLGKIFEDKSGDKKVVFKNGGQLGSSPLPVYEYEKIVEDVKKANPRYVFV